MPESKCRCAMSTRSALVSRGFPGDACICRALKFLLKPCSPELLYISHHSKLMPQKHHLKTRTTWIIIRYFLSTKLQTSNLLHQKARDFKPLRRTSKTTKSSFHRPAVRALCGGSAPTGVCWWSSSGATLPGWSEQGSSRQMQRSESVLEIFGYDTAVQVLS